MKSAMTVESTPQSARGGYTDIPASAALNRSTKDKGQTVRDDETEALHLLERTNRLLNPYRDQKEQGKKFPQLPWIGLLHPG